MHVSGKAIVSFPVTVLTDPEICKDRQPRRPLPPLSKGFRWVGAFVCSEVSRITRILIFLRSAYMSDPDLNSTCIHEWSIILIFTRYSHMNNRYMLSNFHLFRFVGSFVIRKMFHFDWHPMVSTIWVRPMGGYTVGGLYSGYIYVYIYMYIYIFICSQQKLFDWFWF